MLITRIKREYASFMELEYAHDLAIRTVYSTLIAFRMRPVNLPWLLLIGAPSSGKSLILRPLDEIKDVFVGGDYLSGASLASGYQDVAPKESKSTTKRSVWAGKKQKSRGDINPYSLLPLLDGKTLVIHDWTQIQTGSEGETLRTFDTFRIAFDGTFRVKFGNSEGHICYKATFGIIAGVTPRIDIIRLKQAPLGERFLGMRFNPLGTREIAFKAFSNVSNDRRAWIDRMPKLIAQEMANVPLIIPISSVDTSGYFDTIYDIAVMIATLRTTVPRSRSFGESYVDSIPTPEQPHRLVGQLTAESAGHAYIHDRDKLSQMEIDFLLSMAYGTIPEPTLTVAKWCYRQKESSPQSIEAVTGLSATSSSHILENLAALGYIRRDQADKQVCRYLVTNYFVDIIRRTDFFKGLP